jgi:heme exporter protein C
MTLREDEHTGDAGSGQAVAAPAVPAHTGSTATRVVGVLALAALALWALYGLVWSPPDVEFGDLVRLLYVHVPVAVLMYAGCGITTVASALWLRRRTPGWDALAVAGAELGAIFGALTLLTGAIWGRPTWGTFWTWDARLTSTALLEVLVIGYLALRRVEAWPAGGSRRAAVLGLLLVPNSIVVHYSVDWWRSLHQPATTLKGDPSIQGDMLVALMFGMLAGGLVFVWLLIHRFRLAWLQQRVEQHELDAAVAARLAEARADAEAESAGGGTDTTDVAAGATPRDDVDAEAGAPAPGATAGVADAAEPEPTEASDRPRRAAEPVGEVPS